MRHIVAQSKAQTRTPSLSALTELTGRSGVRTPEFVTATGQPMRRPVAAAALGGLIHLPDQTCAEKSDTTSRKTCSPESSRRWQDGAGGNPRAVIGTVAVVLVGLLGVLGYVVWQQQQNDRAAGLFAGAMTALNSAVVPPPTDGGDLEVAGASGEPWEQPENSYPSEEAKLEAVVPRLLAVSDAYPRLAPGITARYEAAAAQVSLGRHEEAKEHYQRVIDADSEGIHGRMARLGLAEAHVLTGNYESAIALLEGETGVADSPVPVDAVLMLLGRAYRLAGQDADALAAFTRVVEEFPFSAYLSEARREVDTRRLSIHGNASAVG